MKSGKKKTFAAMLLSERSEGKRVMKTQPDPILIRNANFEIQNSKSSNDTVASPPQEITLKPKYTREEKGKWIDPGPNKRSEKREAQKPNEFGGPRRKFLQRRSTEWVMYWVDFRVRVPPPLIKTKQIGKRMKKWKLFWSRARKEFNEKRDDASAQTNSPEFASSNQNEIIKEGEDGLPLAMVFTKETHCERMKGMYP